MGRFLWVCLVWCVVGAAQAGVISPVVWVEKVKRLAEKEDYGDAIYFAVTADKAGKVQAYQVSNKGTPWVKRAIVDIKKVPVWKGTLAEGESVKVTVALMEREASPYNVEEQLGDVTVVLCNRGGRLETTWSAKKTLPLARAPRGKGGKRYVLKGSDSVYEIDFSVGQRGGTGPSVSH